MLAVLHGVKLTRKDLLPETSLQETGCVFVSFTGHPFLVPWTLACAHILPLATWSCSGSLTLCISQHLAMELFPVLCHPELLPTNSHYFSPSSNATIYGLNVRVSYQTHRLKSL